MTNTSLALQGEQFYAKLAKPYPITCSTILRISGLIYWLLKLLYTSVVNHSMAKCTMGLQIHSVFYWKGVKWISLCESQYMSTQPLWRTVFFFFCHQAHGAVIQRRWQTDVSSISTSVFHNVLIQSYLLLTH